jgi:hypothetical protein
LIAGSVLLFTVTGTAAVEALCLGKPVIMFGRVFLANLEGVRVVRDLYSLPDVVRGALGDAPGPLERAGRAALAAMHDCSYPGHPFTLASRNELRPLGEEEERNAGAALESELRRRGVV